MKTTAQTYAERASASIERALYPHKTGGELDMDQRKLLAQAAQVYATLALYSKDFEF